jgi:hypothetical protein
MDRRVGDTLSRFPALVSLFLSPSGRPLPIPDVLFLSLVQPYMISSEILVQTSKIELGRAARNETVAAGGSGGGRGMAAMVSGQFLASIWPGRSWSYRKKSFRAM